jgi:predicted restriction endonuclease
MTIYVGDVISALIKLGGKASYKDLNSEIKKIKENDLTLTWQARVRFLIESHSSDSIVFRKHPRNKDIFYSVNGIGKGVWGLRDFQPLSIDTLAEDINEPPGRNAIVVNRIIRDTAISMFVKRLHNNLCQICNETIPLANGIFYSEAHHIKPLGSPHNGPDNLDNLIILCPNHHAQCDYGAIELKLDKLNIHEDHLINKEYINYHNKNIFKS